MSNMTRRTFVQSAALCGLAGGALLSKMAIAQWPTSIFAKEGTNNVLQALFGDTEIEESKLVEIKAPEIAENGSVVPVRISTSLPNVESISILVDKNPKPLAAHYVMQATNTGSLNTRIKLAKPSTVTVVAKSNGKLYSASQFVKVTIGGCGGG